jgi:hypothetical protein
MLRLYKYVRQAYRNVEMKETFKMYREMFKQLNR